MNTENSVCIEEQNSIKCFYQSQCIKRWKYELFHGGSNIGLISIIQYKTIQCRLAQYWQYSMGAAQQSLRSIFVHTIQKDFCVLMQFAILSHSDRKIRNNSFMFQSKHTHSMVWTYIQLVEMCSVVLFTMRIISFWII